MKDCEDKTSKFLIKLLNMLRSKENAKTITWDMEETGIRILNQKKLEDNLLPRYFRHGKLTSFVRQLNMYDFHKVYLPDGSSVFTHQVFNPRDKQSIFKIKRKGSVHFDENMERLDKMKTLFQSPKDQSKLCKNQPLKKQSFKLLLRNELGSSRDGSGSGSGNGEENQTEQVLNQIISNILPLQLSVNSIRDKIAELRNYGRFKRFLRSSTFLKKIYAKLGIEMDHNDDKLSELSIEQELFGTRKQLTLQSLKMFESGPINLKDTLGMFLT